MTSRKSRVGRREFILSSLATMALAAKEGRVVVRAAPLRQAARFRQDRFCISFWVDPPADAQMAAHYAQIAAANFTVVMGGFGANGPRADVRQLELCRKYGLKAIVSLPGYRVAGAGPAPAAPGGLKRADAFPEQAACWGYFLHDEPSTALFARLRDMVDHLRRVRPGKLGFINLLPNYASTAQLGASSYEQYVARYVRVVNPDVLCTDHYPLMQPGADGRGLYCRNLGVIRKHALAAGVPFWNFFCAMPFDGHEDPTEAQIRWQIYTSLAYGAKGVLYFCYWTPLGFEKGGGLIGLDGRPTRHYYQAQRINAGLKNLGPALMHLTSQAVYRVPRGTNPARILGAAPLVVSPGDYLIGVFKHADGRKAVLLNNYSYTYTAWPTVKFRADLKKVTEVDPATGKETPVVDASPAMPGLQVSLGAGAGRLFLLSRNAE